MPRSSEPAADVDYAVAPVPSRLSVRRLEAVFSSGIWMLVGAFGMVLLAGHLTAPPWASGQHSAGVAIESSSGSLWLSMAHREGDPQQLLVAVDRDTRHAAVYHVDATNGTLTLRSTRNLSWDLLVDDFNGREPSPTALKNMLETGTTPR